MDALHIMLLIIIYYTKYLTTLVYINNNNIIIIVRTFQKLNVSSFSSSIQIENMDVIKFRQEKEGK